MKNLKYILLMGVSIVIFSCGNEDNKEEAEKHEKASSVVELTEKQVKTVGISLSQLEQRELSGTIKTTGKLDVPPQSLISISVPFGGILKQTTLLQGMEIKKGQLIAVIENPEFIQMQQDYIEAKSQLDFAKSDYERQMELAKENVNAQKTLQQAKSNYYSLMGKTSGLKAKLKLLNMDVSSIEGGNIQSTFSIYSPINGYCTQVNTNVGAFVNPQDVLFKIANTESMHAELTVFERDLPKLSVGQKILFKLANETTERSTTINLIGREIGADRTVQVHCNLSAADKDLLPGTYFTAVIETGSDKVFALPDEAITSFEGKNYVFVYKGKENLKTPEGKVTTKEVYDMKEIEVGISEGGFTEIINGSKFPQASKFVTKGSYSLLSKLKNSEEEE